MTVSALPTRALARRRGPYQPLAALLLVAGLGSAPLSVAAQERTERPEPPEDAEEPVESRAPPLEVLPGGMAGTSSFQVGRGFWAGSPDRQFVLRLSGFAHLDTRLPIEVGNEVEASPIIYVRRARLAAEGTLFGTLDYRALFDLVVENATPLDVYLDWRLMPEMRFRLGKFKSPFGFERRGRAYSLLFIERAFPTSIAPNRDFGLFVHGQTVDGFFSYDVAMLAGAADSESISFFRDSPPDFAGRVYLQPFRLMAEPGALRHLGVGMSWTVGVERGDPDNDPRLGRVSTAGRRRFFGLRRGSDPTATAYADGLRARYSLHAHHHYERVNVLLEYTLSSQEVTLGAERAQLAHHAWQLAVGTMLTDDENGFFGVQPRRPFAPHRDEWGAVMVSLRYHEVRFDDATFPRFADPESSARAARGFTMSWQWHLNILLEAQLDVEVVMFEGGAPAGADAPLEVNLMTRIEGRY